MKFNVIELSRFKASGHAMFGSTPAAEWQKHYPPVEDNLCSWALRSLFIQNGNECVLVDTGFSWLDRHILNEYKVEQFKPAHIIVENRGIAPEEISHVIHTHLHVDHCGGSFTDNSDGNLVPAFPNSKYIVSSKQLDTALNPSAFERDSFQPEIIEAFKNHANVQLIDNESFVLPWLELQLYNGHTEGMIVPVIHIGKDSVAFVGDLIPSVVHLNLCSTMDYDVNKLLCLAEREEFLEEAYDNEYILFFQHDAINQCCTLKKEKGKVKSDNIFSLNTLSGFNTPTG